VVVTRRNVIRLYREALIIIVLIAGVIAAAGFASVATSINRATRTNHPQPYPEPTFDGPETPAVANLLVNGWTVTSDAAAATLVDLTAKEYAVIHDGTAQPLRAGVDVNLRPYEQMVLDRLASVQQPAAGGAPLEALRFRGSDDSAAWWQRFREEVIAEARAAGLSQQRYGKRERRLIRGSAAVAAALFAVTLLGYTPGLAAGGFVLTFGLLLVLGERRNGERDTPAGLAAASRWLAVADPGPAYATALGKRPELSAALPFSQADRRTLWSSYGGYWHRVYVAYPPDKFPYGLSAFRLLWTAALMIVLGGGAGVFLTRIFDLAPDADAFGTGVFYFVDLVCVAGFVVALFGLRIAVRAVLDISSPETVSGQVQWVQAWRRNTHPDDSEPGPPWLYYVAIDDGRSDRTTAWGLPDKLLGNVTEGATITIRVRPWSRRILEVWHEQ
jgi:hypothetical protein